VAADSIGSEEKAGFAIHCHGVKRNRWPVPIPDRRELTGANSTKCQALVPAHARPPYDPAALLKLYLCGYLHRVRSSRRLEAECHRNVEVLWLLGQLTPGLQDHRRAGVACTHQRFARSAWGQGSALFTLLCRKLELFGGELLAIDGSKFAAVNARDQNFNADKLQNLIARADARLAG
jgi:transposase